MEQIKQTLGKIKILRDARWEIWQAWHVAKKYREGRIDPIYQFSFHDSLLYWRERHWKLPHVNILQENEIFYQLCIQDVKFFWPKVFGTDGLSWIFNEVFYDPKYNPSSYTHNSAAIHQNGWVIDGGASEGFFTAFAFQKGAGHVVAVEPIPILRSALEMTFANKHEQHRFTVISAGLGKEQGTLLLDLNTLEPWNAHLSINVDKTMGIKIKIVSIDEIVAVQRLQGPGFIKMDVEGAEVDALKGAQSTLKTLKPNLAIAVYHKYDNARECAAIIKDARPDYQVEFRGMYGWTDGSPRPYLLFAW